MATRAAAKRKTGNPFVSMGVPRLLMNQSRQTAAPVPSGSRPNANPAITLPNATTAVTPVAPPPDPFMTTDDMAAQASEYADWGKYISGIDLSTANLETDTKLKLANINQSEGENIEGNNWNAASRGLQASSIKDQNAAKITSQAAGVRTATNENLSNQRGYSAREHARWDTDVKPKLDAKWAGVARRNAEAAAAAAADTSAAAPPADDGAPAAAAPAPSGAGYYAYATRDSKGNAGTMHVYPDGRRVFVKGAWGLGSM